MPDGRAYAAGESTTASLSSSKPGLASRAPFLHVSTSSSSDALINGVTSTPPRSAKQNGWGEVGAGLGGGANSGGDGSSSTHAGGGKDEFGQLPPPRSPVAKTGVSNRRPSAPGQPPVHLRAPSIGSSSSFQRSTSPVNYLPPNLPSSSTTSSAGPQPLRQMQDSILASSSAGFLAQFKFIFLCSLWYMSSAISSNTGKAIFNLFKFPVTLTIVQFFFIASYCFLWTRPTLGMGVLREPSRALLRGVLPMAAFQIGGHVFSSVATSRVPVSTVHTIKALSPLFTVLSYRFLFNVSYTSATYIALIPLTLGVMFACSFDVSASNVFGLICAFGSTLVFVSSNIFFKKIVPSTVGANASSKDGSASTSARLDKINLLFYSSSLAFTFMIPLWIYSDFLPILADSARRTSSGADPRAKTVLYYMFLNGASHFAQNILAFTILSSTSPVTYSIASLVKRIVVILMAIVWFGQSVHPVQAMGIALTFVGLYMYQNAKGEVEKVEKKVRKIEAIREGSFLPTSMGDSKLMNGGGGGYGYDQESRGLNGSAHPQGLNHIHQHQPPPPPPPRHHPPNGAAS